MRGPSGIDVPVPSTPVPMEGNGVKREATPRADHEPKRLRAESGQDMEDERVYLGSTARRSDTLDITVGWDFAIPRHRDAALQLIRRTEPSLIMGSSMCRAKISYNDAEQWRESKQHLEFMAQLYRVQTQKGGWFIHEHPVAATKGFTDALRDCLQDLDAQVVNARECAYEVQARGQDGRARTRAMFFSDSSEI